MLNRIKGISFGIKYERTFRMPDIAGGIIDDIIRESPFEKGRFARIRHSEGGKTLFNEDTKEIVSIDADSIVITLNVDNFEKDYLFIKEKVLPFFIKTVFEKNDINAFNRIGIIFRHEFKGIKAINESVANITNSDIVDQNEYSLRFSKKLPAMKGKVDSTRDDYRNVICTLEREGDEGSATTKVDIDYQYYYTPAIDRVSDLVPVSFLDDALFYLKNSCYDKWMKKFEEVSS